MKIKLWKDNLIKNEYEMEVEEIIKHFMKSKYEEYYNVDRWLPVFINCDLHSTFDIKDFDLLKKEYFKQRK